ncbi:MAG: cytochrome d ubiquinol oxidase subunit II [Solirubrobacterales bacterium]|nr:cytochrome d ubiquinol oxidase subunit II [Solirubrobacterales bacterium]MCB8914965.1 cytochrome d ubiquinol oxidase subunit II [Thermoleophilales bacterium]
MELADVPALLILLGIIAYAVLAGADFGAPIWAVTARGQESERLAQAGHRSMAPVWEANHVWLIFVLVICWTAYPEIFGSIFSTLWIPLLLACLGIIMRAVGYVAGGVSINRKVTWLAAAASLLVPFALGAVIGALVAGNVPPGNAAGDVISSWLAPVPIMVGLLLIATSAYLAAVYLAADASRRGEDELADAFGQRALGAGLLAGLLAIAGLVVLYVDARSFFDAMVSTNGHDNELGRICVLASAIAGTATLLLISTRRYAQARILAAVAVAAIVVGWGLAQQPEILPGLTIREAAASNEVIVELLVAVAIGLVLLIPSLYLLYGLVLGGRFDPLAVPEAEGGRPGQELEPAGRTKMALVAASALLGGLMLFTSDSGARLYIGLALFTCGLVCGIVLLARNLVREQ